MKDCAGKKVTGLVRCGCCGSLMTCETKVKDDKHSYNYLKCNKLRSKCSQKPLNEAKILQQLEKELSLPINISDTMLNNIKAEVKKQLKAENINTTNLKRDITIKLNELDEEAKNLFRGYMKGKCDEKMYNELKTEIEMEKEKLQKDMDRYLEIDAETDEILANIAEIAANVGKFLKSPIISEKRDILKLILSDCKTEGKNIAFSIVKPFNELLKTPETDKWCRWQACARGLKPPRKPLVLASLALLRQTPPGFVIRLAPAPASPFSLLVPLKKPP